MFNFILQVNEIDDIDGHEKYDENGRDVWQR